MRQIGHKPDHAKLKGDIDMLDLEIRNKQELRIAYEILFDRSGRFPSSARNEEKIVEWKKAVRKYLKKPVSEKILVRDRGMDGYVIRYPLPEYIETAEDAEEYFEECEYIHYRPTYYDCTGQAFTSWYKVYRAKDGRFWVYHSIGFDF